ncbi:hypothetical protein Hanom_Chr08g00708161 [Helianthus anomalus]
MGTLNRHLTIEWKQIGLTFKQTEQSTSNVSKSDLESDFESLNLCGTIVNLCGGLQRNQMRISKCIIDLGFLNGLYRNNRRMVGKKPVIGLSS